MKVESRLTYFLKMIKYFPSVIFIVLRFQEFPFFPFSLKYNKFTDGIKNIFWKGENSYVNLYEMYFYRVIDFFKGQNI